MTAREEKEEKEEEEDAMMLAAVGRKKKMEWEGARVETNSVEALTFFFFSRSIAGGPVPTRATMAAPPPAAVRALYRALLKIAARSDDAASLRSEARSRFRAARSADPAGAAALFAEGEARVHDATHHGIPYARLAHADQFSRRSRLEAHALQQQPGGDPAAAAERAAAAAASPAVRAALAAAAERLRKRGGGGA